ncbi:non-ribosomal peptide synthetase [Sesbania bispinosa]|nr:non-ribosomal peptide synthetase [Sesbania bispinosa]
MNCFKEGKDGTRLNNEEKMERERFHPNPYFSKRQRAKRQGGEKRRLKKGLLQNNH